MFRNPENNLSPQQETIIGEVADFTIPWIKAAEPLPDLEVKEVARMTGLPIKDVVDAVLENNNLAIVLDRKGRRVNGNLREAAIKSAPNKRVGRIVQGYGHPYEEVRYNMGLRRLLLRF